MKWYYYVYGAAVICHEKPFGPPFLLGRVVLVFKTLTSLRLRGNAHYYYSSDVLTESNEKGSSSLESHRCR